MPSTHLSLHYHLVFSTKDRLPMITSDWENSLHAYLGGITRELKGVPLAIGGIEDHVHLLVGLRAIHRLDYVLRDIKSGSSRGTHETVGKRKFDSQPGYAGVTLSASKIAKVKRYILNQEERHRRQT